MCKAEAELLLGRAGVKPAPAGAAVVFVVQSFESIPW
jgi:hypothetical protein